MRSYVVQRGDSPAKIAIAYAGCPKCTADLAAVNPQKQRVVYPNGFVTFDSLKVGERLALPDKWFDGTLDRLPRAYFDGLPAPPTGLGRPPSQQGLGATIGGALSHCDAFSMNVTLSDPQGDPMDFFNASAFSVTASPQLSDGSFNVNGIYTGPAGFSWQDGVDWTPVAGAATTGTMMINSFTVTGKSTVGACGQFQPPGGQLPGGVPGGAGNIKTCPGNTVPDVATGACVTPCPDGSAPSNGSCGSGGGKGTTTPFQYVTGHRIQANGKTTSGGNVPASVAASTVASVQAEYDKSSPGQYKVVSVDLTPSISFKGAYSAITIILDYCGPNQSVLDPSTGLTPEGVAMTYTHTDLGASPAGASCAPTTPGVTPPSSTTSTGTVVVGGIALAAVVGGILYATMR